MNANCPQPLGHCGAAFHAGVWSLAWLVRWQAGFVLQQIMVQDEVPAARNTKPFRQGASTTSATSIAMADRIA
jgi:hypothetical protein